MLVGITWGVTMDIVPGDETTVVTGDEMMMDVVVGDETMMDVVAWDETTMDVVAGTVDAIRKHKSSWHVDVLAAFIPELKG